MGKGLIDSSVSIIIPAYNASRTIIRTLDSLKNQTRFDLIKEILVINDGSTDDTVALIEDYKKQNNNIPIQIINKANGGVSTARNLGLKLASGEWIGLCDSDDEWLPEKLEIQSDIIMRNSNIDFLGGNHTDADLKILGKKVTSLHKATLKELCIKMYPQTSAALFKKNIIDSIGGYDENRRYCEDGQFFMKICDKYNYYYHPDKVVEFDGGKRGFGGSGLSGNLKGMQDGLRKNILELKQQKKIGTGFYVLIKLFIEMKYIRRCILCKVEK